MFSNITRVGARVRIGFGLEFGFVKKSCVAKSRRTHRIFQLVPYYLGYKALALYPRYKATPVFITDTRPWLYKVAIFDDFALKT